MKLVRVMTLMQRGDSNDEVTRDNSIDFGAAELAGYNLNLNVCLQVVSCPHHCFRLSTCVVLG